MAETEKKLQKDIIKENWEAKKREIDTLNKKIPTTEQLLSDIPFLKAFSGKMNSKVFKGDTLHVMHTACMMEILQQLKILNENLENLLDASEITEGVTAPAIRTSKKLSRDK